MKREVDGKGGKSTILLFACAGVCAAAGFALSPVCPINKALWSPSFALVVGGYSFAMFALFHWMIDVKGWTRWTFFFRVIGMNSITIYMAQRMADFGRTRNYFFNGLVSLCPPDWGAVLNAMAYIAVCWLFLWFLYRQRLFLKV